MNTTFLLMAEYGTAVIPLEIVAERYLGLDTRAAKARAKHGELPFPAYRDASQKAPWLVHVSDLAEWIDAERAKARADLLARRVA